MLWTTPPCPSSVCNAAPVAGSHSLIVESYDAYDADASSRPFGENVTELTSPLCPSSVCSAGLQADCILGCLRIQLGMFFLNCLRIMLLSGANMRAEEYI